MFTGYFKSSRGSIIVDATCSLPIFIIALCIILMLAAQTGIEDTVFFSMCGAAADTNTVIAAADASYDQDSSLAEKTAAYASFSASLWNSVSSEWNSSSKPSVHLSALEYDQDEYLSDGTHIDNLVSAEVCFDTKIPVVGSSIYKINSTRTIVFRPWVGESRQDTAFDDTRVYIFPKRGEHYHNASCSCLKNGEIQMILNKSLRKKYSACTTCHAGDLPDGSAVFLMSGRSGAFHRKSCPCIAKAFESIALTDAVSMGYTACGLCGGTPDNYDPCNDLFR